ncbi:MAG: sulfotransferase family protein [Pseudohaliea sp.]
MAYIERLAIGGDMRLKCPAKPNFMIIGSARCGTTSLHKYLQHHHDIFLSEPKETNFFSRDRFYSKGERWYLSHFKTTAYAVGEASTSYTSAPNVSETPRRIRQLLGENIKFIYIVRDPVERILSHYIHYAFRGQTVEPLDRILEEKKSSIINQGRYAYQLDQYLQHFEKANFFVTTLNQLKAKPQETMESLYKFLGVRPILLPAEKQAVHNKNTEFIEMTEFGKALMQFYNHHFEHLALPYFIGQSLENIARLGGRRFTKPILSRQTLEDIRSFYVNDMRKLKAEWGIDLIEYW